MYSPQNNFLGAKGLIFTHFAFYHYEFEPSSLAIKLLKNS